LSDGDHELVVNLTDSMAVGIASLATDGTILASNPAFTDLIGRTSAVGTSFFDLFGSDADTLKDACTALLTAGRTSETGIETVITLPGGHRRPVELRGGVIRSDGGEPDGVTVAIIDRSARAEAEAESARLKALFQDIGELIGIMAPDGTVLSMNASALEFFGGTPAAKGLLQFVPAGASSYLMDEILPALVTTGRWEGEVDLLRHDGVHVPHHVTLQRQADTSAPTTSGAGTTEGEDRSAGAYWWAIARDRSMARAAAEADVLRRVNADKDQFIASVSHELRTPLTTIRGFADVLAGGVVTESERAEYIRVIQHEAYAMSVIVEDLLVAARVEAGHITIVPRELDMRHVVDQVISALPGTGGSVGNAVEEATTAVGDEMRVRQVVRNLVSNSIRHGGSRVWVESGIEGGDVLVHVCDDGGGVADSIRESMFQPYVSRPNDGARPESVGLGLTVSRQLARLMDGDIEYAYTGHSRFTLRLPGSLA
jgi:PAS domain S-box-containing protein